MILPHFVGQIHLKFFTTLIWGLLFFIYKRIKPVGTAQLLTIYLVLWFAAMISPISTPLPLSRVRLRQALRSEYHNSSSSLSTNFSNQDTSVGTVPLWNWPMLPWFVNQVQMFWPILSRVPQFRVSFREMSWTPEWNYQTLPPLIDRTYAPLIRAPLAKLSQSGHSCIIYLPDPI